MANTDTATQTTTTTLPERSAAESLSHDLKSLMVRSEKALDREGLHEQLQRLERWMESYCLGLSAAAKMSERGADLLHQTRAQLVLSMEELHRLEDEGGNPANSKQAEQAEELARAIRSIDRLLPVLEQAFHPETANATH